ncbi:hypothetical protein PAECIP111890_03186 [Paenibacillus sp. JJ-223]|nr:hypothetical protein PAECIP111890_03186 [Paenibacillus sp. JJ-223]
MRTLFFIFMTLCIINFCFPKVGWYLRYGWITRGESEPESSHMIFVRMTSLIMLIVAFTLSVG